MIHELTKTIDVETPLGYGKAIAWIDYGEQINTVWKVVLYDGGIVRNFYDDDILVHPNAMDGGTIDKDYFNKRREAQNERIRQLEKMFDKSKDQSFFQSIKNHFKGGNEEIKEI